MSVKKWTDIRT